MLGEANPILLPGRFLGFTAGCFVQAFLRYPNWSYTPQNEQVPWKILVGRKRSFPFKMARFLWNMVVFRGVQSGTFEAAPFALFSCFLGGGDSPGVKISRPEKNPESPTKKIPQGLQASCSIDAKGLGFSVFRWKKRRFESKKSRLVFSGHRGWFFSGFLLLRKKKKGWDRSPPCLLRFLHKILIFLVEWVFFLEKWSTSFLGVLSSKRFDDFCRPTLYSCSTPSAKKIFIEFLETLGISQTSAIFLSHWHAKKRAVEKTRYSLSGEMCWARLGGEKKTAPLSFANDDVN